MPMSVGPSGCANPQRSTTTTVINQSDCDVMLYVVRLHSRLGPASRTQEERNEMTKRMAEKRQRKMTFFETSKPEIIKMESNAIETISIREERKPQYASILQRCANINNDKIFILSFAFLPVQTAKPT